MSTRTARSTPALRLLLCEDDHLIRPVTAEILRRHGYEVVACENAEGAIEAAGESPRLDLLVTDVVMPGITGTELARRLLETHPNLRVLFVSGYPQEATIPSGPGFTGAAYLQKPYPPGVLLDRLASLIED